MANNGSKLNPRQRRAIAAVLSTRNVEEAAERANVGARTLYRGLTEPVFCAELARAEGQAIDAATRQLIGLQDSAIDTHRRILDDKEAKDPTRLRAVQSVLDYLLKLRELRNIEQRLTALEASIGADLEATVGSISRRLSALEAEQEARIRVARKEAVRGFLDWIEENTSEAEEYTFWRWSRQRFNDPAIPPTADELLDLLGGHAELQPGDDELVTALEARIPIELLEAMQGAFSAILPGDPAADVAH